MPVKWLEGNSLLLYWRIAQLPCDHAQLVRRWSAVGMWPETGEHCVAKPETIQKRQPSRALWRLYARSASAGSNWAIAGIGARTRE
jgi:hypothetical protein